MNLFGGVIPITGITFLMFSIFAIIAVGFALGRITIKGISLGDAGVFLVALLFGCLFYDVLDSQLTVKLIGVSVSYTSNALKIVENLGLVSENPEENYVQLPSSTQWSDDFTEEDYKALVAAIFNGEIVVSNNIDITPAENVTVISVNDLGNIK